MAEFIEVAKANDLKPGALKMVKIGDHQFVLARVGDKYYAADNLCPHMGGNLSAGKLNGNVLTCPRHHSQFDITDGRVLRWTDWSGIQLFMTKLLKSPRPLHMYEVKLEGDKVLLKN